MKRFFTVTMCLALIISGAFLFSPSGKYSHAAEAESYIINYDGSYAGGYAFKFNGSFYIPEGMINTSCFVNKAVSVDQEKHYLMVDSSALDIELADSELSEYVKKYAGAIGFPMRKFQDIYCFPLEAVAGIFRLDYSFNGSSLELAKAGGELKSASVNTDCKAISSLIDKSKNVGYGKEIELTKGSRVYLLGEYGNLCRIRTSDGDYAYTRKSNLKELSSEAASMNIYAPKKDKSIHAEDGSLTVAWENTSREIPGHLSVPEKQNGLEILAPVWMRLRVDGEGFVENFCDAAYVKKAHENGYKVWATVNNNMTQKGSTKSTTAIFNDENALKRSVAQYIIYAAIYGLDGLNIDYEDLPDADAASYVAFIKELRSLSERQGLVLSVDVAIPSQWSLEYDRKGLSQYVDFVAVMSYGEHHSANSGIGPIASREWVDKVVNDCLAEGVPASKLMLGIPTYAYVWVTDDADGKIIEISAVSMNWVEKTLREKNLSPKYLSDLEQNYIEYPGQNAGTTCRIWIEDEKTLEMRREIMLKYGLAGAAVWQYSYSADYVWPAIGK